MVYFLIFFVITLVDTLVFKVLVAKMAGDLDVALPDYAESLKHCSIANVAGTLLRMAGTNFPVHFVYFLHIFYNKYGLNRAAVFICLLVMYVINMGVITVMVPMLTH
jgi:hypothetical protein